MKKIRIRENKFTDRFEREPQPITAGIEEMMWRSMEKAIVTKNKDLELTIFEFMQHAIYLSIRHISIQHFHHYINFPARIYELTGSKHANDASFYDSHSESTKRSAQVLRQIMWLFLGAALKDQDNKTKRIEITKFYFHSFASYALFLFVLFRKKDHENFKYAVKQFYLISDPLSTELFQLKSKKREIRMNAFPDLNLLEDVNKQLEIASRFGIFRRHMLKGITSWIINAYSDGETDLVETQSYLRLFTSFQDTIEDSSDEIADLFFFTSPETSMGYMGWLGWGHMNREDSEIYSPPQPTEWLTLGTVVYAIKNDHYPDFSRTRENDIAKALGVTITVREITEKMLKDEEKWLAFFNINTQQLHARIDRFLSSIKILESLQQRFNEIHISQIPLSRTKIDALREEIGISWEKQRRIHYLFEKMGRTELVNDDISVRRKVGIRTYLPKGKMMLIDGPYYQPIYGISDLGGKVGRWEDDAFFNTALKDVKNSITSDSIVEAIEKAIQQLTENEIQPNLILLSPEYSFQDEMLLEHEDFTGPKQQRQDHFAFYEIGTFRNIPMYGSFSALIDNKVLVCDFKRAFLMRYRINENWYKQKLNIIFRELTDAEVQARYLKETEQPANLPVEEGDILTRIKSSAFLELWTELEFQVVDDTAYAIGVIN